MPHGRHIYAKAYDMENTTMCAYSQSQINTTMNGRGRLVLIWGQM